MKRPTIEEIHEVMREAGMKVFERPFDVALGGIRTKDKKSNRFNDWLFASFFTNNGGIVSVIVEGTTDAGLYYRMNPVNIDGTAIIQHGVQHRGAYTYMKKGGHRGQEAFRQTGNMTYWRDNDRNEQLDFEGEVEHAIYNTTVMTWVLLEITLVNGRRVVGDLSTKIWTYFIKWHEFRFRMDYVINFHLRFLMKIDLT